MADRLLAEEVAKNFIERLQNNGIDPHPKLTSLIETFVREVRADIDLEYSLADGKSKPSSSCYGCSVCNAKENTRLNRMMVLCPSCGNKRCPRASDHRFACTGSNDPGQDGSFYGTSWEDLETALKESKKDDPVWQRLNEIAAKVADIGDEVLKERNKK